MDKNELHLALKHLKSRVLEIDGPYSKTLRAIIAIDALYNVVIDDEVMDICIACDEPVWESDKTSGLSDDGWYHSECAERHASAPPEPTHD